MADRTQFSYLEKDGFTVQKLGEFHYRVANRFDIMPNNRNAVWAWHDLVTQKRGRLYMGEFRKFIPEYFKRNPMPMQTAIPDGSLWKCLEPGCDFQMADDDSDFAWKKKLDHLETHE
jgi:hypothetical protein